MTIAYAAVLLVLLVVAVGLGLVTGRKVAMADLGPEVGSAHFRRRLPFAIAIAGGAVLFAVGISLLPLAKLFVLADIMFLLLCGFALSALTVVLSRRRGFGRVLLRLPRGKTNSLYLVLGGLFLGLGLIWLLGGAFLGLGLIWSLAIPSAVVQGIGWVSLGILIGVTGLIPFEVREGGISILDRAIPWSRVQSYGWEGTERSVLTLEVARRHRPFRTLRHRVPAQHREELISILRDKVAQ